MKELTLSPKEKVELELFHSQLTDKKKSDRIKAILLYSEGWDASSISQALRVHESTVKRHIEDYLVGKLSSENGGSSSKLSEQQTQALIAHLSEHMYHYSYEIIAYIKGIYDVSYTVPGINKWLHRHGFSYKHPKGFPYKAEPSAQAAFLDTYEALKETVSSQEPILFADSVHPTQATKISYGWIKTGQTKQVETTASRTRLNIVGGIELGNLENAVIESYDTVNAHSIMDFLERIKAAYPRAPNLHLILDQAGYHRSHAVKEAAKKLNITLHYLPPYSPNLNPIERLWKVMNEQARNNRFFKSSKDFKDAIMNFFKNTLPSIARSLDTRINDNFQMISLPATSS